MDSFAPLETFGDVWGHLSLKLWGMHLALGGERLGVQLIILQHASQLLTTKNYLA